MNMSTLECEYSESFTLYPIAITNIYSKYLPMRMSINKTFFYLFCFKHLFTDKFNIYNFLSLFFLVPFFRPCFFYHCFPVTFFLDSISIVYKKNNNKKYKTMLSIIQAQSSYSYRFSIQFRFKINLLNR